MFLGDFEYELIEEANHILGPIYFLSYVLFVFFILLVSLRFQLNNNIQLCNFHEMYGTLILIIFLFSKEHVSGYNKRHLWHCKR